MGRAIGLHAASRRFPIFAAAAPLAPAQRTCRGLFFHMASRAERRADDHLLLDPISRYNEVDRDPDPHTQGRVGSRAGPDYPTTSPLQTAFAFASSSSVASTCSHKNSGRPKCPYTAVFR